MIDLIVIYPIPNIPNYFISKCGKVYHDKKDEYKIVPTYKTKDGYISFQTYHPPDINRTLSLHRTLAIVFIPNPHNKPVIDHINHNRSDNRLSNLRWATYSENSYNRLNPSGTVCYDKQSYLKKWRASYFKYDPINNSSERFIRYYLTEEDAWNWVDEMRQNYPRIII